MSDFVCPKCNLPLDSAHAVDGIVTCAGCQTPYSIPEPVQNTQPMGSPDALSELDVFSDEFPSVTAADDATFSPSVSVNPFDVVTKDPSADEPVDRRPTKWLPYVAVAIVLGCIGLFTIVLLSVVAEDKPEPENGGTRNRGPNQVASADPDSSSQADDSSDEAEPTDDEPGGVLDLSDLNALDSLDTADMVVPTVKSTPQVSTNRYGWPQSVTLVSIPGGQVGSVDGVAQVDWTDAGLGDRSLTLPSPAGTHHLRTAAGLETLSVTSSGFAEYYSGQLDLYRGEEGLDLEKLSAQLVTVGGVFNDPVLPHLIGNAYWQSGHGESAVRFWNAAVRLTPSFAPSHLNLAFEASQRGELEIANRELYLATILNVQDTFGIARHITQLRRELPSTIQQTYQYSDKDYFPVGDYDQPTQKLIHVLTTLKELASDSADRAACLNNIGVFLMHKKRSPRTAFSYFLQAQQELNLGDRSGQSEIASTILDNLVRSAEQAGFPEAKLFRQVKSATQ